MDEIAKASRRRNISNPLLLRSTFPEDSITEMAITAGSVSRKHVINQAVQLAVVCIPIISKNSFKRVSFSNTIDLTVTLTIYTSEMVMKSGNTGASALMKLSAVYAGEGNCWENTGSTFAVSIP